MMSLLELSKKIANDSQRVVADWLRMTRVMSSSDVNSKVNAPLLSSDEIVSLANELARMPQSINANSKPSEALRQGEQTSLFMGAGLEYEESRPYEMGDEIRRIDWRQMAKTGKAYTKRFQEERQESWFILVDHRQSMRFGTRVRLKATQATRVAGYFAWLAQQSGIRVAGGRLAESFEVTPIYSGRGSYDHLMTHFSQACPPLSAGLVRHEPALNDVLLELMQQLQPGSRLIVISDFQDISPKTTEIFTALQACALVQAICIQDPVESDLPAVDGLQLQSMSDGHIQSIHSAAQRANYQAWSKQYHQDLQNQLALAGVQSLVLQADAPISDLNALNDMNAAQSSRGSYAN
jgi:uncharacterized protein (DUF58 family)